MAYNIDYETLKNELDLEKDEVDMLVEIFLNTAEDELSNLEDAIEKLNFDQIAKSAHAIKGSSANLRLMYISETAKSIELAAKEKRKIDYKKNYQTLKESIEKIKIT